MDLYFTAGENMRERRKMYFVKVCKCQGYVPQVLPKLLVGDEEGISFTLLMRKPEGSRESSLCPPRALLIPQVQVQLQVQGLGLNAP